MKLLTFLAIGIIGCTATSNKDIKNVYGNREEVLSIFKNVSVFRKGTGNKILLYTYEKDKENEYVFIKGKEKYSLYKDKILFSPDQILGIYRNEQDEALYRKQLTDKLEFYLRKMDSLKISDISSEFFKQRIDLKIYMKSNAIVVYVSDVKNVINPEWVNYLNRMKKLDENWYYAKEDK